MVLGLTKKSKSASNVEEAAPILSGLCGLKQVEFCHFDVEVSVWFEIRCVFGELVCGVC